MPERIYVTTTDGNIEPLQETAFAVESELQRLIAEHPELLDGEQMRPGDPRRWLLISREKGIAETGGEGARWALDHLLVDQDARPTLAEVKRGLNPEIRRTVVGQLLEYAAHASETWTADELRETFLRNAEARGRDPQEDLATLLQSDTERDAEAFWQDVATNLAAKHLRLLFVSDRIPDVLARVVTFLNEQMEHVEVLAVEIKRFQGSTNETLVPRVIGRTGTGAKARQGRRRTRLTRETFLDGFGDERIRAAAESLLDAAQETGARIVYYESFGLSVRVRCEGIPQPISVAWLYSREGTGWMRTRDFTFGTAQSKHELPEDKLQHLERYLHDLRTAAFTQDVSSKGVQAWAVEHEVAIEHLEYLTDLLRRVVTGLNS